MNKNISKTIAVFVIINFITFTLGCSLFAPRTQPITVMTSEEDAEIFINGNLEGVGVVQTVVPRDHECAILAKKEGYHYAVKTIGTTISRIGTLDIVGGCIILFPFFGMLAPGFYELDTDNVMLLMSEDDDED